MPGNVVFVPAAADAAIVTTVVEPSAIGSACAESAVLTYTPIRTHGPVNTVVLLSATSTTAYSHSLFTSMDCLLAIAAPKRPLAAGLGYRICCRLAGATRTRENSPDKAHRPSNA